MNSKCLQRDLQEVVDNKVTDGISNKKASFVSTINVIFEIYFVYCDAY